MAGVRKTEVIRSSRGVFDLRLSELWAYKDLIFLLVKRDFVAQYKQTILGPLWFVIQPILTALMFYLVFGSVAKIPTNNVQPFLFYFTGIAVWSYFSDCLLKTASTFSGNAQLFGKVYFPRLVVPIAVVLAGFYKFLLHALILILCFTYFWVNGTQPFLLDITLLLIPVYMAVLACMGLGIGILCSALTTKYRDLNFLLSFGVQLLMYGTPIIYPLSFTKGVMHKVISFNPLTSIVENMRYSIFGVGAFDVQGLIYSAGVALLLLALGVLVFNRVEQSFMDTV